MANLDFDMIKIRNNCPIEFSVLKCEAGWVEIKCRINEFAFTSCVSTIGLADTPTALLEAAYFFIDYANTNANEVFKINTEFVEEEFIDKNGYTWTDIPKSTKFLWDEEPDTCRWIIEFDLKYFRKVDAVIHITLIRNNFYDNMTAKFDVMLSDFAYAVAKCFTEYIKEYGINA